MNCIFEFGEKHVDVEFHYEDSSFTHEFGNEKSSRIVIDSLKVFVYVGDMPSRADMIDATDKFEKSIEDIYEWVTQKIEENETAA